MKGSNEIVSDTSNNESHGTAIAFLLFGVAGALGLDLCAKWLLADYSLQQFIFLRSIFGLLIFLSISRWYGGLGSLKTTRPVAHIVRTVLATGAMFGFFYGLKFMPLVSALTLAFTAPLMVTVLSVPLLRERVGWRRWLAVVVGFLGVLIVLRPGAGLLTPAAIGILVAAACYAGLAISARMLAATESTLSLAVYVIKGPLLASLIMLPGNISAPTISGWVFFVLAGFASACAWIGIIGGYRRAPPSLLAPFEYTALIGAAIAGYFIWGEVPDKWVICGGAVIIGSGLFIVHREVGRVIAGRYIRAFTAGSSAAIARRFGKNRS